MSSLLKQLSSKFSILKVNKQAALEAIKQLPGRERNLDLDPHNHFSWIDIVELSVDKRGNVTSFRYCFMDAQTLEEALEEWNWHPTVDEDGNITDLIFTGLKEGDYDILFDQIAPFVEAGSEIEVVNEDGWHRKYVFDGKAVHEKHLRAYSERRLNKLFGYTVD